MKNVLAFVLSLSFGLTDSVAFSPLRTSITSRVRGRRFSAVETSSEGLEYVTLKHPSGASSTVYLYGGVVTSYIDAQGTEWVAVRPDAKMDGSKPISGGLSHCFPQFGPGELQQHGFARNLNWDVVDLQESAVTLSLKPSEYTTTMWDKDFECTFKVSVDGECLDTVMEVKNNGQDSFDFQAALHTYFDISSIKDVAIGGSFKGSTFLNKMLDPPADETEERDEIVIGEEYDRVYKGVNDPILKDSGKGKALTISNSGGWKDTVVWNPFGDEGMGYDKFVCVESVAFDSVELNPEGSWIAQLKLIPGDL